MTDTKDSETQDLLTSLTLSRLHELSKQMTLDTTNPFEFKETLKIVTKALVLALDRNEITFSNDETAHYFYSLLTILIDHSIDGRLKDMFQNATIN
ncbi:hypothetical protein QLH52_11880 [Methylomonas sp. OY6]|uniref:Uncharacterized protein n=1 Tax=Methylomonas defluvii TaxID=3045149 RepID=A0ABU4UEU2_9GAMM|nr:hypothetical protein [Methylomonas sp. OY6]MDX8127984.1 hypothetical protein [Methylomonas sp. OY6]